MAIVRARFGRPGEVPPQTRWGKLADLVATRGRLVDVYQLSYSLFTVDFARQLLAGLGNGGLRGGLPLSRFDELACLAGETPTLHAVSILELANFVGERLLRDTDAASMAVALETRVPLLDHQVVEAAAQVPAAIRFQPLGKKRLLRELAMPDLDPSWFDRPKAGFVLPIDIWARHDLVEQVALTLGDRFQCAATGLDADAVARLWRAFTARAPGMYWSRAWAVFVLLWWTREHRVSL
jgi:asparagine synthase (glutamine-hydrolysing)